ncbi:MAG: DEAD/DEAH box helicase family protein [Candidatus Micrarchaeota archaeon]|nr:DEAD/DEAH box helicase family protein [Candidatus Micrarchaeota archaeon]
MLNFKVNQGIKVSLPFESYKSAIIKNLDTYAQNHSKNGELKVVLRGRQVTVFDDLNSFVKDGGLEGYVALPTATGKTPLYIKFIEALTTDTDIKTIIAVPTNVLVEQTEKMLYQFIDREKVEALPNKIGILNYLHKDYSAKLLITTYSSLWLNTENGNIDPKDYQLLILDEAHEAITKRRIETINKFTNAFKLGLTATPEYSEEKKLVNVLPNEIHRMSIREAVYEGLLSNFSVYVVETHTDLTNVKITAHGEYDDKDLDIAVNTASRNLAALEVYQNLFPDTPSAIANCVSISHALAFAELANKNGIPAVAVTSLMNEEERNEALWKYKNGDYKLITNVNILTRGFDAPNATVCLNLAPTLSKVKATQRSGRVLRLDPEEYERNYISKHAYIIDFKDKTSSKRAVPISFAEIAEDAEIIRSQGKYHIDKINKEPRVKPDLKIDGINVITEPKLVMRVVNEGSIQRLKKAPENYLSKVELANTLDVTLGKIGTIISISSEELIKHPEWVGEYFSKNGRPMLHYHNDFVKLLKTTYSKIERPPENWQTATKISKKTGISFHYIKSTIDNLSEELKKHPEWSGFYRKGAGPKEVTKYYHPDFVELIKGAVLKVEVAPDGWSNRAEISKLAGVDPKMIKFVIENLSEELKKHPEWSGIYHRRLGTGPNVVYYHPDFIKLVKASVAEKLTKFTSVPDGWATMTQIGKSKGKSAQNMKPIFKSLSNELKQHPEWSGLYRSKTGLHTFYHPDFIKIVLRKTPSLPLDKAIAPKGWMNQIQIEKSTHRARKNIKLAIEALSEELKVHPEWSGIYRLPIKGGYYMFYHPEFIKMLKAKVEHLGIAPNGWMNGTQISEDINESWYNVKNAIESLSSELKKHPEWSELYNSSNRNLKVTTFYHPEFIALIKKRLQIKGLSRN